MSGFNAVQPYSAPAQFNAPQNHVAPMFEATVSAQAIGQYWRNLPPHEKTRLAVEAEAEISLTFGSIIMPSAQQMDAMLAEALAPSLEQGTDAEKAEAMTLIKANGLATAQLVTAAKTHMANALG